MSFAVPFFSCSSSVLNKYLYPKKLIHVSVSISLFSVHRFWTNWLWCQSEHKVAGGRKIWVERGDTFRAVPKGSSKMRPTHLCGKTVCAGGQRVTGLSNLSNPATQGKGIHTISPSVQCENGFDST